MMTFAPLPRWLSLLKALSPVGVNETDIARPWRREGDYAFCFSRSMWAMEIIVLWWESYFGKTGPTVWIPDYFCNQSLWGIRQTAARLVFYPINEDLRPDWEQCLSLASRKPPDVFVLVHYFGQASDCARARKFCNDHGCVFVEDAAHVLRPVPGIGESGDIIFYSPHKLLAVPDGSVLILRSRGESFRNIDFAVPLAAFEKTIGEFGRDASRPWMWLFKRIVQKAAGEHVLNLFNREAPPFDADLPCGRPSFTPGLSVLGRKLLWYSAKDMSEIASMRRRNASVMGHLLESEFGLRPCPNALKDDFCPYLLVFRAESPDRANELYTGLLAKGIILQGWPDLPPEILAEQERHFVAIRLRKTLMTFPVHQSLNLGKFIRRYGFCRDNEKKVNDRYTILWDILDRDKWNEQLMLTGKSNLLQSWEYGEAKARVEGWKVRRGIVTDNDRTVALLQALEKGLPFIGKVVRINRAPLYPGGSPSREEKKAVYSAIKSEFNRAKRKILFIAPELEDSPENIVMLHSLGYGLLRRCGWRSLWLDLRKPVDDLRKGLKSNWRNHLTLAEKNGLELTVSSAEADFDWLMGKYKEMTVEKGFKGPSVSLLSSLRNCADKNTMSVFQALHGIDKVAGLLVVTHGSACTYLIGWNGPSGRKLNANNFLLWNAVIEMKRMGLSWFDLGGIDDDETPHISRFKRGMGGKEYCLVGEMQTLWC